MVNELTAYERQELLKWLSGDGNADVYDSVRIDAVINTITDRASLMAIRRAL